MSEHIDGELLLVSEAVCQQVIDQAAAFEAVEEQFKKIGTFDHSDDEYEDFNESHIIREHEHISARRYTKSTLPHSQGS